MYGYLYQQSFYIRSTRVSANHSQTVYIAPIKLEILSKKQKLIEILQSSFNNQPNDLHKDIHLLEDKLKDFTHKSAYLSELYNFYEKC